MATGRIRVVDICYLLIVQSAFPIATAGLVRFAKVYWRFKKVFKGFNVL